MGLRRLRGVIPALQSLVGHDNVSCRNSTSHFL